MMGLCYIVPPWLLSLLLLPGFCQGRRVPRCHVPSPDDKTAGISSEAAHRSSFGSGARRRGGDQSG